MLRCNMTPSRDADHRRPDRRPEPGPLHGRGHGWRAVGRAGSPGTVTVMALLLCGLLAGLARAGEARADGSAPRAVQATAAVSAPGPLPALGVAADGTTVSGLSSGGYMAGQFHVAYAASLAGAAVLAGGPLGCSRGSMVLAMLECSCPAAAALQPGSSAAAGLGALACRRPLPAALAARADAALQNNRAHLDDPRHLARQRVYLMAGAQDPVVPPALVAAQADFYRRHGVPEAALRLRTVPGAAHGLPAPGGPVQCDVTAPPYLTNCPGVDAAGELLAWLYAPPPAVLAAPVPPRPPGLRPFDQRPYRARPRQDGLDDSGWLYLPAACEQQAGCRLHVVFHGCQQGQGFAGPDGRPVGRRFAEQSGYLRWAEANRIVLLFPQVRARDGLPGTPGYNPQGCWDFWGYTHASGAADGALGPYLRREAPQLRAVKAMVDALRRPRP